METSDESFAWTDASSDSSKDMSFDIKQNKSEQHSERGEAYKKKVHNELPETGQLGEKKQVKKWKKHAIHVETENDNSDYQINRSIKSEPSSDFDVPKSKKRHKSNSTSIRSTYDESLHDAEEYLNLRVKQEQASFVEPTPIKSKKKKKCKVEPEAIEDQELEIYIPFKNEIEIEENHLDTSSFVNGELSEISEKYGSKRKKKKNRSSEDNDRSEIFEDQDNSRKTRTKKKDKELLENYGSDDHELQNGVENNSQIISSTLLNNPVHDNDSEQCNYDIQSVSTLLNTIKCSSQGPGVMEKKASRISDKIRFEDDSVDYQLEEYAPKIDISTQLKQFISSNINLTALQADSPGNAVLSEDDEVWIVKGPHEISARDFEETNISLESKQKVKLNGNTYDSIVNTSTCAVPILLYYKHKTFIKNTPLRGVIHLRKRIPKVHIPYESLMTSNENSFIALPDTKCRHPLFGINYKKAMKIPTAISERLNPSNVPMKKKKKKHKIKEKHEIESDFEVKPNINVSHSNKKRKKMKQEKHEIESENEMKPSVEVLHSKKKKQKLKLPIQSDDELKSNIVVLQWNNKKRKHSDDKPAVSKKAKRGKPKLELSGADAWESEQAIEKTLFDF